MEPESWPSGDYLLRYLPFPTLNHHRGQMSTRAGAHVPAVGHPATITRTPTVSLVALARASRVARSARCSAAASATSASYTAPPAIPKWLSTSGSRPAASGPRSRGGANRSLSSRAATAGATRRSPGSRVRTEHHGSPGWLGQVPCRHPAGATGCGDEHELRPLGVAVAGLHLLPDGQLQRRSIWDLVRRPHRHSPHERDPVIASDSLAPSRRRFSTDTALRRPERHRESTWPPRSQQVDGYLVVRDLLVPSS